MYWFHEDKGGLLTIVSNLRPKEEEGINKFITFAPLK
jgi:hypothetical protein